MKDIFGNDIQVGCEVVYNYPWYGHTRTLLRGKIEKISKSTVTVRADEPTGVYDRAYNGGMTGVTFRSLLSIAKNTDDNGVFRGVIVTRPPVQAD